MAPSKMPRIKKGKYTPLIIPSLVKGSLITFRGFITYSFNPCETYSSNHVPKSGGTIENIRNTLLGGTPQLSRWLGSPPFISHGKAIWKGNE